VTHANAALISRARLKLARFIVAAGSPVARAAERFQVHGRRPGGGPTAFLP
jgi:hypothetical protein